MNWPGHDRHPGPLAGFDASIQTALAGFRWAAWVWNATVLLLARHKLVAPIPAWTLVGLALLVTLLATGFARQRDERLVSKWFVAFELSIAMGLQLADGFVYGPEHVFSSEPSLGVAWPMAAVLATALAWGPVGGVIGGLTVGLGRVVSTLFALGRPMAVGTIETFEGAELISLVTTIFLYTLAGTAVGMIGTSLRRAEREIAGARAREEVARTLHDGVLQTLALVERRTDDPALARLAREQERELREYLFGAGGLDVIGRGDLGDALRKAASHFEQVYDGRVEVLVPDDLPKVSSRVIHALVGAAGEALTNAGKHGGAQRITIYVEPDADGGGVFCSIKDDGIGFDVATTAEGVGLRSSIRGRITEVGGTVTYRSSTDRGTEVQLTVPAR